MALTSGFDLMEVVVLTLMFVLGVWTLGRRG
jgi:hypothetical protein